MRPLALFTPADMQCLYIHNLPVVLLASSVLALAAQLSLMSTVSKL